VANAPFRDRFDAVADLRAVIVINGAFDRARIIINEETRRPKDLRPRLLHLVKLNGSGNRICRTAVELALIVNWRATPSEIDSRRRRAQVLAVRDVVEIAMIGKVPDPSVEKVGPSGNVRAARPPLPMNFPSHVGCVTKNLIDIEFFGELITKRRCKSLTARTP